MVSVSPEDIAHGCALGPKQHKLVSELLGREWVSIRPYFFPGCAGQPSHLYGETALPSASAWSLLKRLRKNGFTVVREWDSPRRQTGRVKIFFEEVS